MLHHMNFFVQAAAYRMEILTVVVGIVVIPVYKF